MLFLEFDKIYVGLLGKPNSSQLLSHLKKCNWALKIFNRLHLQSILKSYAHSEVSGDFFTNIPRYVRIHGLPVKPRANFQICFHYCMHIECRRFCNYSSFICGTFRDYLKIIVGKFHSEL